MFISLLEQVGETFEAKDFSAFLMDIAVNHTTNWCRVCLGHFDSLNSLAAQHVYCRGIDDTRQIFILAEKCRSQL